MLERARLDVHVEAELVVLHVERLDVLVVPQALEDRLAAGRADAAVLERDDLVVEHRDELLDGHHVVLAAHLHVHVHARRLHELRREDAVGAVLLVGLRLRLEGVGIQDWPVGVGAAVDAVRGGDRIPEIGRHLGLERSAAAEVTARWKRKSPFVTYF